MALGLPVAALACVNLMDLPDLLKIIEIWCPHRVIACCREVTAYVSSTLEEYNMIA